MAESQAREEKKKFKKSKKERKLKSRKKASIVEELEAMVSSFILLLPIDPVSESCFDVFVFFLLSGWLFENE